MYHAPRWSPNGESIVVVGMASSGPKVFVIPAGGGEPVTVATGRIVPAAAEWATDGKIIVIGDSPGTSNQSFILDRDGSNVRPFRRDSVMAATRDSSTLLFESARGGLSAIAAMDRRRTAARLLTTGFWAEQPTISPDGRTIVFEKRVDPDNMLASSVVTMRLDGGNQKDIASGTDPSWSPDGALVLFKTPDATGQLWVATVDPSTGVVRRLAKGVHPQWSPSGRHIVYMRDEPGVDSDVYVMTREGREGRCLTCGLRPQ